MPSDILSEVKALQRRLPRASFEMCKTVFYIFDEDKNGFISRSEAQRGVSYLAAEGFIVAPSQKNVGSIFDSCIETRTSKGIQVGQDIADQLRFVDFVRLFLTVKAVGSKVAPTKLGVA